jgi:hypothetical protein
MRQRAALEAERDAPELSVINEVSTGTMETVVRIQALSSPTRFFTISKKGEVVMFDASMR